MPSAIDPTKPTAINATTASVRANFAAAKSEIEALQGAPGGSRGLNFLASATANNSASVAFTANINATYDEYLVVITDLVPQNSGDSLYARFSNAGVWQSANDAYSSNMSWTQGANPTRQNYGADATSIILIGYNILNDAGASFCAEVRFFKPQSARRKTLICAAAYQNSASEQMQLSTVGHLLYPLTPIDGIQFLMQTANIATGTFALYGLAKQA